MKQYRITSRFIILMMIFVFLATGCQPQAPQATDVPVAPPPTEIPATQAPLATPTMAPPPPTAEVLPEISANLMLDPALATDADSLKVSGYLYQGLVSLDASGQPQPALAASWVVSDDTLDYIFTIRTDAAFNDGAAITPDVIVDNFNRWFDPQSPLRGTGDYANWKKAFLGFLGDKDAEGRPLSPVDGIQKVDVSTIIIHLNRPEPNLLTLLADPAFGILKTEQIAAGGYSSVSSDLVTSGPYQVAELTATNLTLSPNPQYKGSAAAAGNIKFTLK